MKSQSTEEALLFEVVDLFFSHRMSVPEIAEKTKLSRQSIYPLITKARDRGLISLNPPIEKELAKRLTEKYKCIPGSITVVNVSGMQMAEHVAAAAAARVLELIRTLGAIGSNPVGLGLGPGRATLDFSRHLARLLSNNPSLPQLKLFAICAGCPATSPECASVSFFNLYPRHAIKECVGLFAETLVRPSELKEILERPGVKEGFTKKDEISIVVTALGDIEDEHDLLRMFLESSKVDTAALKRAGWVGNVQYRPFSETMPLLEMGNDFRAVTLFELSEFVEMAKTKNRHVILIARPCTVCGKSRAKVLRPLLKSKALKVWSEIVTDVPTAWELLQDA